MEPTEGLVRREYRSYIRQLICEPYSAEAWRGKTRDICRIDGHQKLRLRSVKSFSVDENLPRSKRIIRKGIKLMDQNDMKSQTSGS